MRSGKQAIQDNTVILFTSDNGFLCGSHGYGSKVLPYEEASRAPLIVLDPRHRNSGQQLRSDSLTGNIDIAPTVIGARWGASARRARWKESAADLCDPQLPKPTPSLPLINVWGPPACHSLAIVTKDLKYIYWSHDQGGFEACEELYDTTGDPNELTNVVARPP